jgi:multicomponent Na+:H+ antiporter subunit G
MIVFEWLTALLLLLGSSLALLAAIGVLRFPDTFSRMQASSKASTLGLACLLAATALQFPDVAVLVRLGSIAAFVMLTAPLSAHIVARAALHRGTPLWSATVLNEYDASACDSANPPVDVPVPENPGTGPES